MSSRSTSKRANAHSELLGRLTRLVAPDAKEALTVDAGTTFLDRLGASALEQTCTFLDGLLVLVLLALLCARRTSDWERARVKRLVVAAFQRLRVVDDHDAEGEVRSRVERRCQ